MPLFEIERHVIRTFSLNEAEPDVRVTSNGMDLQLMIPILFYFQVYNAPCIVTDYPKDIKAFYMKLNPDGKTVAAMDILVPKIGKTPPTTTKQIFLILIILSDDLEEV